MRICLFEHHDGSFVCRKCSSSQKWQSRCVFLWLGAYGDISLLRLRLRAFYSSDGWRRGPIDGLKSLRRFMFIVHVTTPFIQYSSVSVWADIHSRDTDRSRGFIVYHKKKKRWWPCFMIDQQFTAEYTESVVQYSHSGILSTLKGGFMFMQTSVTSG